MIGEKFNMDNVFLRDLTTCVLFNLEFPYPIQTDNVKFLPL